MTSPALPATLGHRLARMTGRDPNESHRAATPLELLFDLAFVVAFSQAADQLAHLLAEGHFGPAIGGFGFAMFAICWAWINFTWFASAYDTDDWFFRITTMVQMIGVVILALGMPPVFHSLDEGHSLDNQVLVAGYVIMRIAMVAQWLRAAKQDPRRRPVALTYAGFIVVAQIGWVVLAILHLELGPTFAVAAVLYLIELGGPVTAERRGAKGSGGATPWHAHHIAERYGLLTIIALGEGVLGTIASVSAVIEGHGWSSDAVILIVAGIGLTFGLWWGYFTLPSGVILHHFRNRAWIWGYGHLVLFAAIAATGAGLHVVAYVVEGASELSTTAALLSVAIPVLLFLIAMFALYAYLIRSFDPFHIGLLLGSLALIATGVLLAEAGVALAVCLIMVTLAPFVVVVGYETVGHRHQAASLRRALS